MNLKENISLKPYNTFGIESTAAYFCAFRSVDELLETLEIAKRRLPVTGMLVLGGGSNILLTQNINGLVLKNEIDGIEKLHESEDEILIKAGGEGLTGTGLLCIALKIITRVLRTLH